MLILSKSVRSKKYVYSFVCLFIMACCIIYSVNITNYVILGIKICLYSVIPSLLPFMLITNYMQAHNLCTTVSAIFHPYFQQIDELVGIWNLCLNNRFYKWLSYGCKNNR